jgi:hypothetical protein
MGRNVRIGFSQIGTGEHLFLHGMGMILLPHKTIRPVAKKRC